MAIIPPTRRRWFQFRLGAIFVVMALAAVGLYWPIRVQQAKRARIAYQEARIMWDTSLIPTAEMCEAAVSLYRAEMAIPFADREKAATDHCARIEGIWNRAYGPASDWQMGIANDRQYQEENARREKIKDYYKEAARIAGVVLPEPIE